LKAGRQCITSEEEEDDRSRYADFNGEDPAVSDDKCTRSEKQGKVDLKAGFFDGEVGEVLAAVFDDWDSELLAPASVIPVYELSGCEGGNNAPNSDGDEH